MSRKKHAPSSESILTVVELGLESVIAFVRFSLLRFQITWR